MDEQTFEELAKRHPDLFQKARVESFEIGLGWYDLVDTLCDQISKKVESLRSRLKYAIEKDTGNILELERALAKAIEELPVIAQVKEKFGTLRFYVDGGTEEHHHYINFAESMSQKICEDCGDRGRSREGSWIKVRCDKHQEEHEEAFSYTSPFHRKPGPKLSEESFEE